MWCTIRAETAVVGAVQRLREVDTNAVVEARRWSARVALLAVRADVARAALALVPFLRTHHIDYPVTHITLITNYIYLLHTIETLV